MFFQQQKSSTGKIIGAGVAGIALGMVAGMMLAPKSGKEMRTDMKKWSDDMMGELQERVKNTQDITQEKYNQLVDAVSQKYRNMQNIKANEVDDFTGDLKNRWDRVKNEWSK